MLNGRRVGLVVLLGAAGVAAAQSTAPVSRTLAGEVLNSVTGKGIPRALVTVNARSMLTDAEGRFSFENFTDAQAFAMARKPGFSGAEGLAGPGMIRVTNLDAPLVLHLSPEAVLFGTLTRRDGLPMARTFIAAVGAAFDETGLRQRGTQFVVTNERGEFRFTEPAGMYRLEVRYAPHMAETGQAVMPVSFPAGSPASGAGYMTLAAGEQREVNLHPAVRDGRPVRIRMVGTEDNLGVRLEASAGGEWFNVPATMREGGVVETVLPPGSYRIRATVEDRAEALSGEGRVVVEAAGGTGTLALQPEAVLPSEVSFGDLAATGSGSAASAPVLPNVMQLGLTLRSDRDAEELDAQDRRPAGSPQSGYAFRLPPGRYRLEGGQGSQWTVQSVTYGGSNLMTDAVEIAAGAAGGGAIRVQVSNVTGTVSGTVTAAEGASVDGALLYAFARTPALRKAYSMRISSSASQPAEATYHLQLPPGSYAVMAVPQQLAVDLGDAGVVARLTRGASLLTVAGQTSVTADLTVRAVAP